MLAFWGALAGTLGLYWLVFGYLANQVFPQPLSAEEERRCLEEMEAGSREARDRLIEHNLRLVAHVVRKYESRRDELDDLISIGTIGLIKAINSFKMERDVRLATYASRCVENEVLMYLRATKKNKQDVSIYDPIGFDKEGNEIALVDVLAAEDDMVDTLADKIQGERILSKLHVLSPRERQVIEMRYGIFSGLKETQRDIARLLGVSRSYVSRIESRAIHKLIAELGEGSD
ncbi:MAG: RNA polymerase sporulation sigma factor SigK [Syntrophomonadaceae bacterium]|nr:RNA polymerase sporulation sigma factor SigK [Syntrophomonadaceae bacterium]